MNRRLKALLTFFIVLLISTCLGIYIQINDMLAAVKGNARPPTRAVLVSAFISDITGGYWENELARQAQLVANLPIEERLDFYTAILTYRDIEASKAMVFVDIVTPDEMPLLNKLISLRHSDKFLAFDLQEQKRIQEWIDEFNIIFHQGRNNR
jgi:hypothetical protein